jgi:hypothetical protein
MERDCYVEMYHVLATGVRLTTLQLLHQRTAGSASLSGSLPAGGDAHTVHEHCIASCLNTQCLESWLQVGPVLLVGMSRHP